MKTPAQIEMIAAAQIGYEIAINKLSVEAAFDKVLGQGTYKKLASEIYDELKKK